MARKRQSSTPEPAAEMRPASVGVPARREAGTQVVIRAGHRHRGVPYPEHTPYDASPEEIDLLRRYGALVEE